ncbi:MAG: DsbA family protein [Ectothiorhodospiraceae bacterium]|nr:DsbA family protein [Ectothiorhodospiraceae bacterium]
MMDGKPGIPVSLFFDYNCPWCYLASGRLGRLRRHYHLDVLWRFIETRPSVPAGGAEAPPSLRRPDPALRRLLEEEKLPWQPAGIVANTRRAILLAQTTLLQQPSRFIALHERLFLAGFAEGRNIGDPATLRDLADELDLNALLHTAWETPAAMQVLLSHVEEAQRLGLQEVPTIVVAGRAFAGVTAVDLLEQALMQHTGCP